MKGATWRKSSYSGSNGGECIEVGGHYGRVLVRDTKDREGPVLRVSPAVWRRFADRVKSARLLQPILATSADPGRGALLYPEVPLPRAWTCSPRGLARARNTRLAVELRQGLIRGTDGSGRWSRYQRGANMI